MPKKDKATIKKSAPAGKIIRSTPQKKKDTTETATKPELKKQEAKPKSIPSLEVKPKVQTAEGWIRSRK